MQVLSASAVPIRLWWQFGGLPTVLHVDDQEGSFKQAFAATLVGLRAEKRIGPQAELGRLAGVSEWTVQRWEDPRKPHLPNAWELRRLAEALGVETGELLYPQELSERERQLARRAARAVRSATTPQAAGGRG